MRSATVFAVLFAAFCLAGAPAAPAATAPLTVEQLLSIRSADGAAISPDGRWIAFRRTVPRDLAEEDDGESHVELAVVPWEGGEARTYVGAPVRVSQVAFGPDSAELFFLAKREGDEHTALYSIALAGGEARRRASAPTAILDYAVAPDGSRVAWIAKPDRSKEQRALREKGYDAEVFEEDWLPRRVWIAPLDRGGDGGGGRDEGAEPRALELDGSAFQLAWSPDGSRLAVTLAPRPLVDDRYMFRRIAVVDPADGSVKARVANPGKLGAFRWSPDGRHIALIGAADPNDPAEGRLQVVSAADGGAPRDLLPDLPAHVAAFGWIDATTLAAVIDEKEETRLARIGLDGSVRDVARSGGGVPVFLDLDVARDGRRAAATGESPDHPGEVFAIDLASGRLDRRTRSNPWLADVRLAEQTALEFPAQDGVPLGGVLIRPLETSLGDPAPLVLIVHGGPESHVRNGWVTSYSRPGQILAAKGYAVFYPNYRGSTGRGVAYSKTSQGDAAGKEFRDLVDSVDRLVADGIADGDRVGITGGSYGGYATAWASTYYTDRFRAGVMFVGISNKLSKGFTTDIPVEDKMVHTRFDPWTKWEFSLERSPIYHAEKSRTALLIAVGTDDPRVHPSQSLQMYRALKLIGKTPVRFVRYPGEEHGNARAASREDYLRRVLRWFDRFLLTDTRELPPPEIEGYLGTPEKDPQPGG